MSAIAIGLLVLAGAALTGAGGVSILLSILAYRQDHPRGAFAEYGNLCTHLPFRSYLRNPMVIPTASHCWHKDDTNIYPQCCICGKGHPDFKEKKDGSRKESSPVQGH